MKELLNTPKRSQTGTSLRDVVLSNIQDTPFLKGQANFSATDAVSIHGAFNKFTDFFFTGI